MVRTEKGLCKKLWRRKGCTKMLM